MISWKSNAWTQISTRVGKLVSMYFSKSRSDTYLRLTWSSNFRIFGNQKCAQWYFMINGRRCNSPASVEGNFYYGIGGAIHFNTHRHGTITGICKGTSAGSLSSGNHDVSVWAGQCPRRPDLAGGSLESGWDSTSTMIVEELCPSQ